MSKDNHEPAREYRQHGSGSVIKLGAGRFRIGYDVAPSGFPRQQRFEVVRGTKREAEDRLRTRIEQTRKGEFADDDRATFEDLSLRFLSAKKLSKEATTHRLYERTLKQHVLPVIGNVRARNLKSADIEHLLQSATNGSRTKERGLPLSGTTLKNVRTIIRAVLSFGVKHGALFRNVADLVEPPAPPHTERAVIGVHDVDKLLTAAKGTELFAVISFALGTGSRRSEICGLQWADIDLTTGHFMKKRAAKLLDGKVVIGNLKTKSSVRADTMPEFLIPILKQHRLLQLERHMRLGLGNIGEDAFVFERDNAEPWNPNEMSRMFSRLVRRNKLRPMRFHDMRHSYASLRHASGSSLKDISESLGHSNINVTANLYVHLLDDSKRENAARFNAFLGAKVPSLRPADDSRG